jgi:hypothetical protein
LKYRQKMLGCSMAQLENQSIVSLENLEMSEGKGIIFPLQFMGNVISSTGPRGSNSWRPWLMLVNTIRMMQACQRSRDQTQIAKGQSER